MRELPTSTRLWCGTHHHRQYRWASSTRQKTRMGRQQDCSSHCATDISVKTVAPTNARSGGVSARSICAKSVASECHRGLLIGWAPFAVAISCRLRNTHAIIDGEGLSSQKARTNGREHYRCAGCGKTAVFTANQREYDCNDKKRYIVASRSRCGECQKEWLALKAEVTDYPELLRQDPPAEQLTHMKTVLDRLKKLKGVKRDTALYQRIENKLREASDPKTTDG